MRQLYKLNIERKIMELFYTSVMQSVMSYAITCWFGNSTVESRNMLMRITKQCGKLGVGNTLSLLELYNMASVRRYQVIIQDVSHPLHNKYERLPSGKRLRSIQCHTARYSKSFVPSNIRLINDLNLV